MKEWIDEFLKTEFSLKNRIVEFLKKVAFALFFGIQIVLLLIIGDYVDVFGNTKVDMGRTKNSIAAVVAGIVGQKLHERAAIDLEIQKTLFPDARVTGNVDRNSVNTRVRLMFSSVHFEGRLDAKGRLSGEVHKSEFNWQVRQTSENSYEIARWGPKFDGRLDIVVKYGIIFGTYARNGPHFDWKIRGTYDENGDVECKIGGPFTLGIVLKGKITKQIKYGSNS